MKKYDFTQDLNDQIIYNEEGVKEAPKKLFENEPELLRPRSVAKLLGLSVNTIYDWKYRGKKRNIPCDLFISVNRSLFINTKVLRRWLLSNT